MITNICSTVSPSSLDPSYRVSYYIKCVRTSRTYITHLPLTLIVLGGGGSNKLTIWLSKSSITQKMDLDITRVAPDTDLARYPAAGYPAK